jgi:hypothetical protein
MDREPDGDGEVPPEGTVTPEGLTVKRGGEGALRKRLHDGKRKLQERIVRMAEKSFQVYRLPPDFEKRCICGCRRSEAAIKRKNERR